MFKNSVPTSRRAQRLYFSDNLLILFEETVSACSENQYSLWTKCRFGFNVHRAILWRVKFETWIKYPQYCTDSLHGKGTWLLFIRRTHRVATNDCSVNREVVHYLLQCPDKVVWIPPFKQAQCENWGLLGYNTAGSGNSLPRFGTTCRSRLQGLKNPRLLTLEDGTDRLSQNAVKNYHYPLRNSPEGRSSYPLRGGSLNSHKVQCGLTNGEKHYNSAPLSSALSISLFVSSIHLYVFNNSNTI